MNIYRKAYTNLNVKTNKLEKCKAVVLSGHVKSWCGVYNLNLNTNLILSLNIERGYPSKKSVKFGHQ